MTSSAAPLPITSSAKTGRLLRHHFRGRHPSAGEKGSDIKDFKDLAGKPVVVTSGTTSEVLLNKLNDSDKMNMRIISAKDHGDSFRTLESGRAVAFMMDDALLAGERAKAKPDQWEIIGTPQSKEAYGCMLRKDDPEFKSWSMTPSPRRKPPVKRPSGLTNGSSSLFHRKTST